MHINILGCRFGNFIIYRKYVIGTMVCWAFILIYATIYTMEAVLEYKIPSNDDEDIASSDGNFTGLCPKSTDKKIKTVYLVKRKWSGKEKNYMFGCTYIGYILFHIPGGIISDKYGTRHVLSIGVLGNGIITGILPLFVTNTAWQFLALLYFVFGCFHGLCVPASASITSQWAPARQLTFLTVYGYSGATLAQVLCWNLAPIFINYFHNWQSLFYTWTAMSIVWYVIFMYVVFSQPSKDSNVSYEEKREMEKEMGVRMPPDIPWKDILLHGGVWALFIGKIGQSMLLYTTEEYFPKFCKRVLDIDLKANMHVYSLSFIWLWVSIMATGYLGNTLIRKRYMPIMYMRIMFGSIGCILPSILILLTSYAGCSRAIILSSFVLTMVAKGPVYSAFKPNVLDISRHYSGCVVTVYNALPSSLSALCPILANFMRKDDSISEWRKFFWLNFTTMVFTTALYMLYLSGDKAKWDVVRYYDPEIEKKRNLLKSGGEQNAQTKNNKKGILSKV